MDTGFCSNYREEHPFNEFGLEELVNHCLSGEDRADHILDLQRVVPHLVMAGESTSQGVRYSQDRQELSPGDNALREILGMDSS